MQYIIHLHQFEPQTYHDELFDLKERILLRSLQLRVATIRAKIVTSSIRSKISKI